MDQPPDGTFAIGNPFRLDWTLTQAVDECRALGLPYGNLSEAMQAVATALAVSGAGITVWYYLGKGIIPFTSPALKLAAARSSFPRSPLGAGIGSQRTPVERFRAGGCTCDRWPLGLRRKLAGDASSRIALTCSTWMVGHP